jgi:hypothetical protein
MDHIKKLGPFHAGKENEDKAEQVEAKKGGYTDGEAEALILDRCGIGKKEGEKQDEDKDCGALRDDFNVETISPNDNAAYSDRKAKQGQDKTE